MMQIRQLQVAHDVAQDRLVLRIATQANEEIRAFITRRFLRDLWPVLVKVLFEHLDQTAVMATGETPTPKEPIGNFTEPFRDDHASYPLGSNPLLVSEIQLEPTSPDTVRVTLREGRERSFNLNLNGEMMQAFCAMLRASCEQARWDLELAYASEGTPAAKGLAGSDAAISSPRLDATKKHLH